MKAITLVVTINYGNIDALVRLDEETNNFCRSHQILSVGGNDFLPGTAASSPVVARTLTYDDDDENP